MNHNKQGNRIFGVSGSTLKIIGILSMAVDHFGVAIVYFMLENPSVPIEMLVPLKIVYQLMRQVGRIAFPIFCFMLVEGYVHTSNRKKYVYRLMLFAVVSEIPFDLALSHQFISWKQQNVFFTLALGLLTIMAWEKLSLQSFRMGGTLCRWGKLGGVLGSGILASAFHTDYGFFGIVAILLLYLTRENRARQCVTGALIFSWEMPASFAYVLLYFYNGKIGVGMKYFFYLFYPVHLLLYYVLRILVLNG